LFFWLFYRYKVEWEFDPATVGTCIIAPNHASYLDPPLISASWPAPLYFFAGSHLFKKRLLRALLSRLHTQPVVKGKELATVRSAAQLLKSGKSIVLFPEGTRSYDGQLQELRTGVALLSTLSGCPIIPCFIQGTQKAWPKEQHYPTLFGNTTTCRFGKPIYPKSFTSKEELTQALQMELERLAKLCDKQ
jgi:1-acyl-sn-glycerol-3-phosphate acyltransferase